MPQNKAEWAAAAKTYNVIGKTLLTWPDLRSGSKVNKEQYLLYRVLLPDCKEPESLNPLRLGIPTTLITQAQNVLYKRQTYRLYMKMLGNDNWTDPVLDHLDQ